MPLSTASYVPLSFIYSRCPLHCPDVIILKSVHVSVVSLRSCIHEGIVYGSVSLAYYNSSLLPTLTALNIVCTQDNIIFQDMSSCAVLLVCLFVCSATYNYHLQHSYIKQRFITNSLKSSPSVAKSPA